MRGTNFLKACLLLVLGLCGARAAAQSNAEGTWPTTGGNPGGQRYSPLRQINTQNVAKLRQIWTAHTNAIEWQTDASGRRVATEKTRLSAFESTPVLMDGTLYVSTPADQVIALDAQTGAQRWRYDPHLKSVSIASRGVAVWKGRTAGGLCSARVFVGTLDATLIALDATTGIPCEEFGLHGVVDLSKDVEFNTGDNYSITSPPVIVGNVVIVGSSIQDNSRVDMEKGVVRGYDAVSGQLLWTWDPIPWSESQKLRTGAGNAWSYISADVEHGLVFVPTGSASPDFYGGMRSGDNRDANSVVALDAASGKRIWGFQTTHHDVWDYDVASQPVLFEYRGKTPAIAITTKMGLVFVLNRLTGEPLVPVTERPVPQSDVPGEQTSPTQPFSSLPSLAPIDWPADAMWGSNTEDDRACRKQIAGLRYEGIYTPPSLRGSVQFPGNLGGVNWGSPALDPVTGVLYASTNRYAFSVQLYTEANAEQSAQQEHRMRRLQMIAVLVVALALIAISIRRRGPKGGVMTMVILTLIGVTGWMFFHHVNRQHKVREKEQFLASAHFGNEVGLQLGTPYHMRREPLRAPSGKPCTPQPWGALSAINLNTGKATWQTPLGTLLAGQSTGTLNLGGPIVTAGGIVFAAGSSEPLIRAFDATTGKELWQGDLPVPAQSTPMTYSIHGRQFVVVSAGGHGSFGTPLGDSIVAFSVN